MEHEKIHVSYIPIVRALMALATICKADLAVASIMPHAMPAKIVNLHMPAIVVDHRMAVDHRRCLSIIENAIGFPKRVSAMVSREESCSAFLKTQ